MYAIQCWCSTGELSPSIRVHIRVHICCADTKKSTRGKKKESKREKEKSPKVEEADATTAGATTAETSDGNDLDCFHKDMSKKEAEGTPLLTLNSRVPRPVVCCLLGVIRGRPFNYVSAAQRTHL